jgi:hypothetical protein
LIDDAEGRTGVTEGGAKLRGDPQGCASLV